VPNPSSACAIERWLADDSTTESTREAESQPRGTWTKVNILAKAIVAPKDSKDSHSQASGASRPVTPVVSTPRTPLVEGYRTARYPPSSGVPVQAPTRMVHPAHVRRMEPVRVKQAPHQSVEHVDAGCVSQMLAGLHSLTEPGPRGVACQLKTGVGPSLHADLSAIRSYASHLGKRVQQPSVAQDLARMSAIAGQLEMILEEHAASGA
jgi:hypothetical protein